MTDDPPKPSRSLLGDLPPTDPAELKAMEERRLEMLHYAAIGRIAANWSHFEALVDTSSVKLAGLDSETGVCFTSHIFGSGRKLDAFIALARLRRISDKIASDLMDFAKDVRALSVQRDRTIHDFWYFPHPGAPHRVEATAPKLVRLVAIPVTTEELLKLNHHIENLQHRFAALLSRLNSELHPLPEK